MRKIFATTLRGKEFLLFTGMYSIHNTKKNSKASVEKWTKR